MTLIFSNQPKRLIEIILGDWAKAELPPGFSHTVAAISGIICYCQENNLYPIINDDNWCYGKWQDYFQSFWDEHVLKDLRDSAIEKTIVDLNFKEGCGYTYGMDFLRLPYVQTRWKEVAYQILQLNQTTKDKINAEIDVHDIDLALHTRLGYENPGGYTIQMYGQKIQDLIKQHNLPHDRIFVLTDTRQAVEFFEDLFGKPVFTLCPLDFDGIARHIRTPENLYLMMKELEIVRHAQYFIGKANGVSEMGHILRQYQNSFVI